MGPPRNRWPHHRGRHPDHGLPRPPHEPPRPGHEAARRHSANISGRVSAPAPPAALATEGGVRALTISRSDPNGSADHRGRRATWVGSPADVVLEIPADDTL